MDVQEITDLELAFPADVMKLMPTWEEIPVEFKHDGTKWNRLFSDWFYAGVKDLHFVPKPGIETKLALRHIMAIMGSFQPQHQHKEAAVAYLLSQWFEDVTWTRKEKA